MAARLRVSLFVMDESRLRPDHLFRLRAFSRQIKDAFKQLCRLRPPAPREPLFSDFALLFVTDDEGVDVGYPPDQTARAPAAVRNFGWEDPNLWGHVLERSAHRSHDRLGHVHDKLLAGFLGILSLRHR